MFLHLSVILFTGGGVSALLHAERHPTGRHLTLDTQPLPLDRHRHPPSDTTGYGQQAGVTNSIGMHTC